jgi:group I intron endonuclease
MGAACTRIEVRVRPNISGVYSITNIVTNRVYIGQALNLRKRENRHRCGLSNNKHENRHLQNSYNKYGKDNFIFNVLLYCEPFELTRYEQKLLDIANNTYNIRISNVNSNIGIVRSEETKRKIGDSNRGRIFSEEARKNMSEAQKGKTTWNKGKHGCYSKEALEKIRTANIGKTASEETRRKMSESRKGYVTPETTKLKLSIANKGNLPWTTGIKLPEETKTKISEAVKAYWDRRHSEKL